MHTHQLLINAHNTCTHKTNNAKIGYTQQTTQNAAQKKENKKEGGREGGREHTCTCKTETKRQC